MPPLERSHSSQLDTTPGPANSNATSQVEHHHHDGLEKTQRHPSNDLKQSDHRKYFNNSTKLRPIGQRRAAAGGRIQSSFCSNDSITASRNKSNSSSDSTQGCHTDMVEFMTRFLCIAPTKAQPYHVRRPGNPRKQMMQATTTTTTMSGLRTQTWSMDKSVSSSSRKTRPVEKKMQVLYPIPRYPLDELNQDQGVVLNGPPRRKTLILGPGIAFRPVMADRQDENSERHRHP